MTAFVSVDCRIEDEGTGNLRIDSAIYTWQGREFCSVKVNDSGCIAFLLCQHSNLDKTDVFELNNNKSLSLNIYLFIHLFKICLQS